jgi:transcriptional regulator of heat shock response
VNVILENTSEKVKNDQLRELNATLKQHARIDTLTLKDHYVNYVMRGGRKYDDALNKTKELVFDFPFGANVDTITQVMRILSKFQQLNVLISMMTAEGSEQFVEYVIASADVAEWDRLRFGCVVIINQRFNGPTSIDYKKAVEILHAKAKRIIQSIDNAPDAIFMAMLETPAPRSFIQKNGTKLSKDVQAIIDSNNQNGGAKRFKYAAFDPKSTSYHELCDHV